MDLKDQGKIIPADFHGFVYEPDNEEETVALFLKVMDRLKPSWCVERLQMDFPDGIFFDLGRNIDIRVEFEYFSSHFLQHKHDPKGCDLVICWEDDLSQTTTKDLGLPILALKNELTKFDSKHLCLGRKRETNLDIIIRSEALNGGRGAQAIQRLLEKEIPVLQTKYSRLILDRSLTKHYMLKWSGKSILGFYPSGKLVVMKVDQYCHQFGDRSRDIAEQFHETVRKNVPNIIVTSKLSDSELNERVRILLKAIDDFCAGLKDLEEENHDDNSPR